MDTRAHRATKNILIFRMVFPIEPTRTYICRSLEGRHDGRNLRTNLRVRPASDRLPMEERGFRSPFR